MPVASRVIFRRTRRIWCAGNHTPPRVHGDSAMNRLLEESRRTGRSATRSGPQFQPTASCGDPVGAGSILDGLRELVRRGGPEPAEYAQVAHSFRLLEQAGVP